MTPIKPEVGFCALHGTFDLECAGIASGCRLCDSVSGRVTQELLASRGLTEAQFRADPSRLLPLVAEAVA